MPVRLLTLTLNPAIDLASSAETVEPTHKIRTSGEHIDPGGGGINVARVLHALGGDVTALILAGGVTGHLIDELLTQVGVPRQVLPMAGRTRISMTVLDRSTRLEYRFVPEGPVVTEAEWRAALSALERAEGEWVIASGSIPRGVPDDIYARAARIATSRRQRFVLDTSGPALRAALHSGVYLIKPSLRELEVLVGRRLPDRQAQEQEAVRLVRSGAAEMVAVTLGGEGALLATAEGVIMIPALSGPVRSAVGAGDAFLAGMVLSLSRGENPADALAWGIATGTAAVAEIGTARVTLPAVQAQHARLKTA